MIRMIVLALGLIAFIAVGLLPPRQYGFVGPEMTGQVPGRTFLFGEDIYTMWQENTGHPAQVDTGRLLAEAMIIVGVTGLGLIAGALAKR